MSFTPTEKLRLAEARDIGFSMEEAIGHVFNNEYILVIGNENILNPDTADGFSDVNKYILYQVNKDLKTSYSSFDEVMLHSNTDIDPIRNLLTRKDFSDSLVNDVSTELKEMLETKLFKVVITTCCDSCIEKLMGKIWEDKELNVVNIWDGTSLAKFYKLLAEYNLPKDYNEPTLIYAYGKCEEKESLRFAHKDFEYIQTIEKWLNFDKCHNLMIQFIQSKRLLSLGCKFDDWYFRFFWYILRRDESKQRDGDIAIAFNQNDRSDKNLETYLKNARVTIQSSMNTIEFMQQMTKVLTSMDEENPYRDLVIQYRRKGKMFLSYCNKDRKKASEVFTQLHKLYPNLWFDQENILGGANYETEIEYGINHATVFIALLTPQVAEDLKKNDTSHYYNEEWRMAAERKNELTIIPLATEGFLLREPYYKVFEQIVGDKVTGISLSEDDDAFSKLEKSIEKHLNG